MRGHFHRVARAPIKPAATTNAATDASASHVPGPAAAFTTLSPVSGSSSARTPSNNTAPASTAAPRAGRERTAITRPMIRKTS